MRSILNAEPSSAETITVTDMEAGIEHLSRGTTRHSDVMLVVAEPYYKSLETAGQVNKMAADLGIPNTYVVANKVRSDSDAKAIAAYCEKQGMEIIATIPYDDEVAAASLVPESPLDRYPDSPGVQAVADLAQRLSSQNGA